MATHPAIRGDDWKQHLAEHHHVDGLDSHHRALIVHARLPIHSHPQPDRPDVAQPAPDDRLAAAACVVLLAISERNLRYGDTPTVLIPRGRLRDLEQALEAGWPGYLAAQRTAGA